MRLLDFQPAPLLLGFVLGPLMEENLRRALLLSRGSFSTFVDRPISATLIVMTALILLWAVWVTVRDARRVRLQPAV
jgi:TctA family transporter